ncbi:S1 family peptidase [Sphingomonas sp. H160509]|uniref:S1 family peptidase n=1 Tax=Sphingomonas sp. H160509 TaxID=2955313 RepID=UPI002096E20E|nr:S1 family peptidase [Sphingomonas sp. H160509]MDD1452192.1 S1 family peptidase [Sphingomonas sp. H160509]
MTPRKTRAPRISSFMFTISVRWFLAATLLALGAGPVSAAQVQLPVDALMQDAGEYATRFGVPFDEALRRMRAQGATVPATDALRETYKDRWAGVAIEHQPNYRIVVLLTGTDPVADQSVMAGGMVVPIVFRTGAPATREAVLAAITAYQAKIRESLPHPPGLGVDQRTGELVVMIASGDADLDRDGALRARIATMTGVPVRIEAVDKPPVNMAQDLVVPVPTLIPAPIDSGAIEGGGRVVGTVDGKRYACTTGFVVSDGLRNGVVTAAHCPDALSYVGKRPSDGSREEWPLAFVGQWGWGYQDVQVNVATAPDVGYAPLFYADTAKTLARPVATWRYRTSTRAGDFVCHRGERTGYSCAVIAMVDFAPAGDLCGGACLPTWVAVEGPTCKAGDSGAPVFEGSTALGLVKGGTYRRDGTCLFYYYMSTDYLPQGWTLLHQ